MSKLSYLSSPLAGLTFSASPPVVTARILPALTITTTKSNGKNKNRQKARKEGTCEANIDQDHPRVCNLRCYASTGPRFPYLSSSVAKVNQPERRATLVNVQNTIITATTTTTNRPQCTTMQAESMEETRKSQTHYGLCRHLPHHQHHSSFAAIASALLWDRPASFARSPRPERRRAPPS